MVDCKIVSKECVLSKHQLILTVTSRWYFKLSSIRPTRLSTLCLCITRPLKLLTDLQFLLGRLLFRSLLHRMNHLHCRYETGTFRLARCQKNARHVSSRAFFRNSNTEVQYLDCYVFSERGECNETGKFPSYLSRGKPYLNTWRILQ